MVLAATNAFFGRILVRSERRWTTFRSGVWNRTIVTSDGVVIVVHPCLLLIMACGCGQFVPRIKESLLTARHLEVGDDDQLSDGLVEQFLPVPHHR